MTVVYYCIGTYMKEEKADRHDATDLTMLQLAYDQLSGKIIK